MKERNWRDGYVKHVVGHVERAVVGGREDTLKMARAGLEYCHDKFEFVRPGQPTVSLREAMDRYREQPFGTGEIVLERGPSAPQTYRVPYKGAELSGDSLLAAARKWEDYGTIEPSAGHAIEALVRNQAEWLEAIRYRPGGRGNVTFVLLGCGAAMGHFRELIDLGVSVIGVDLDRPKVWRGIFRYLKKKAAEKTGGRFRYAIRPGATADTEKGTGMGQNMITETPEIRNWLLSLLTPLVEEDPAHRIVVGNYAYLDGAPHVKVSLAMDAIGSSVAAAFPAQTMLSYLCTPTDCHVIPVEALEAARRNHASLGLSTLLRPFLAANVRPEISVPDPASGGEHTFAVVDALMTRQGPNYALAKRLQHWRAIVAREDSRVRVSSNVAPMTFTESVTHNTLFRFAYGGAANFVPAEIFAPDTSRSITLALLLHDLLHPDSVANPSIPLRNPYELMSHCSFHGGVWRTGFKMDHVGDASAYIYLASPWNWPGELARAVGIKSKL
ncbi:hypothetical protein DFJ74DRAFT_663237 [Hyaloraphidium curvatum]|nr:hypothetical protein DFJ74DRAFT_663237 [Hyaloraphidium curvatum]